MVNRESINEIIEKCLTLARIREKLSSLSRRERTELLKDKLTPLEWKEYEKQMEYFETASQILDEYGQFIGDDEDKWSYLFKSVRRSNENVNEALFKYDRRIFDKSPNIVERKVEVDESQFKSDPNDYDRDRMFDDDSTIQELEKKQIAYQQENANFTDLEKNRMNDYFFNTYGYLNTRLWEGKTSTEEYYSDGIYDEDELYYYNREFPKMIRSLDNCINKSKGLLENTRLYHGGMVDIHLVPGMHGVLKGYTSTSFQRETAERLANEKREGSDWVIEILAPSGTKGICANDHENFDNNSYTFEHEYTLGRNQGYTVVSMDYENKVQVILLDEP